MTRLRPQLLVLVAAFLLAGCGGGGLTQEEARDRARLYAQQVMCVPPKGAREEGEEVDICRTVGEAQHVLGSVWRVPFGVDVCLSIDVDEFGSTLERRWEFSFQGAALIDCAFRP